MANGDIVSTNPEFRHVILIDQATATTDGVWVDLGFYRYNLAIHVSGITSATVTVNGSSGTATGGLPSNAVNGTAIGTAITGDDWFTVSQAPRFIKARVTVYASGTVTVVLMASRG